jgi:hypothetical protein
MDGGTGWGEIWKTRQRSKIAMVHSAKGADVRAGASVKETYSGSVLLKVLGVLLREGCKVLGDLANRVDRGLLANGDAGPAVNAVHRVDVKLSDLFELRFILAGMNTVNRANLNALLIFGATFNDNESHESFLLG